MPCHCDEKVEKKQNKNKVTKNVIETQAPSEMDVECVTYADFSLKLKKNIQSLLAINIHKHTDQASVEEEQRDK